ncbi:MAG: hypothetical protein HY907_06460 [Deltaproteobacteria bacterium]|nr:hypothetical protein [Deltaproteobacteria bacterium]
MDRAAPFLRAVLATSVVLAALLAMRLGLDRRAGRMPVPAGWSATSTCFDVAGATADPGLRCAARPGVDEAAPLPPCATREARARVEFLAQRCNWHGRRLVLAPVAAGGPCAPRLVPLPAALRVALGIPLDPGTAARADLEALPGVGSGTARRIVEAQERLGASFRLDAVPGLGPRRAARIAPLLQSVPAAPPECGGPP